MPLFKHLSKRYIHKHFTHYGLLFGLIPVYVGNVEGECTLSTRNWVPECTINLIEMVINSCDFVLQFLGVDFEPHFKIKLTGEIKKPDI